MSLPDMHITVGLIIAGLLVGTMSGMVGIGGGILVIPVLMIGFGFSQAKANGTSMAMLLPPIGLFAVLNYWRSGNIDPTYAALLALGFAIGAYFGARAVNSGRVNPMVLRILFSVLLLYVAGRMLFRAHGLARAALETICLMAVYLGGYAGMRLLGRRFEQMPDWSAEYKKRRALTLEQDYEI